MEAVCGSDADIYCWDKLCDSLDSVVSAGDFAIMKRYSTYTNPVLQVNDTTVPLPLVTRDADSIKKSCRQAPFGKGSRTMTDTSVRQTWELGTEQFCLRHPGWELFLRSIVGEVCNSLGVVDPVDAVPHKLLLYEKGSFFSAHRDSEKAAGMIATLVICLPSEHEGGTVSLSYAGKSREFSTGGERSPFDVTALAWFADVSHEVGEVTAGYRLALTYNIVQRSGEKMSATALDRQAGAVRDALAQCSREDLASGWKLYSLDHLYSRSSFALKTLKGRDRALCEILNQFCPRSGFYFLLGHLRKNVSRQPEEHELEEVRFTLDQVNAPNGAVVASGIISLDEEHISNIYPEDRHWDDFEESEHLGNEESDEIYKYHDTVSHTCYWAPAILTPRRCPR